MSRTDSTRVSSPIGKLGSLPVVIAIFVLIDAGYLLLVAFGNITDPGSNWQFVHHVLSMDTTNFGDGPSPNTAWRAIDATPLQVIGYVFIILWEVLGAIVLFVGFIMWIRERGTAYARARAWSSLGLVMLVLLFMGGFVVVGGEWFQMWSSTKWNGIETAFRNVVLAGIPLVLIHMPSAIWSRQDADSAA